MTGNSSSIIGGAAYTHSVMRLPPAWTNPVLWAYLGGGLAKSQNLVGTQLTNIGAGPHYPPEGNYASFTAATNALELPVADQAGDFTVMFVARNQIPNGICACVSNFFNTPSNQGCDLFLGNAAGLQVFLAGGGLVAGLSPLVVPGGTLNFKFYAFVRRAGVDGTLYDKSDNIVQTAVGTSNKTVSTKFWQIGQNPAGTSHTPGSEVDLAFAGICYSALDATAIDRAYQSVKQTLVLRALKVQ